MFLNLSHGCWMGTYRPPGTITGQVLYPGTGIFWQKQWMLCFKHPCLLCRIEMEGILVILIALNWPRLLWYTHPGKFYGRRIMDHTRPSRSDVPRAKVQSCFIVSGWNGMALKAQVVRDTGILEFVIPIVLKAGKSARSIIRHWRLFSLAGSLVPFTPGASLWDDSSPSCWWVWTSAWHLALSQIKFLHFPFFFRVYWHLSLWLRPTVCTWGLPCCCPWSFLSDFVGSEGCFRLWL